MNATIFTLFGGLSILLIGIGLLGTLLGMRAILESFGNVETGLIMAGYYVGYVAGTHFGPIILRRVGHIRSFAAFAALAAASAMAFGLWVHPLAWLVLRILNGACVVGVYMIVESWLNSQTPNHLRGRIFASYMMSTLLALAAGQFLLLFYHPTGLELFLLAAMLIIIGLIPIAIIRVNEPLIEIDVPLALKRLYQMSPLGAVGAYGSGVVNGMFWGMTAVFAQRLELDSADIAFLISTTIIGGAILQWPIGHLSDNHDRRSVLILVCFSGALVAAATALVVINNYPGLSWIAFLYGGLMFSIYGLSVAHTNDHIEVGQTLAATRGLLLLYGIGAFTGPVLGGIAMEYLGPAGLPIASSSALTVLALFGLFRMTIRAAPPESEQVDFVPMVRTTPVMLVMHPKCEDQSEQILDPIAEKSN